MDALLQELQDDATVKKKAGASAGVPGHYGPGGGGGSGSGFVPQKKGSFVEEGEEHLTTNIFVGNLAPSVTEEQLTDLFRQIGEIDFDTLLLVVLHSFSCVARDIIYESIQKRVFWHMQHA